MEDISSRAEKRRGAFSFYLILALVPVLVFYVVLFLTARNLPLTDDYDAALDFANGLVQLHSFPERLLYFIGSRHNECKILLAQGMVWLELVTAGHLNFSLLSAMGNLFVLPLAAVLWMMFLPNTPKEKRFLLFLPVCFLLFQFQYVETLNWPTSGLQEIPVVPFAIAGIYFLGRRTNKSFVLAVIFLLASICAFGNGFMVAAVGALVLLIDRTYAKLAVWLVAAGLCVWLYAYNYPLEGIHHSSHTSLSALLLRPIYLLSFLGAAARYPVRPASIVLGLGLCLFWAWMIRRGYFREDRVVGYCLLFILLTALSVTGLRSGLGLAQSVSSRYRIYSDLLLIFSWFALVTTYRLDEAPSLRRNRLFTTVLCLSVLFCMSMDVIGIRNLRKRDKSLDIGMSQFEHSGGRLSPVYSVDGTLMGYVGFDEHAREIIVKSEELGTYQPPQY